MKKLLKIMFVSVLILCLNDASAQINPSSLLSATSERVTSTNFYYARPNDLTIIVDLMGYVHLPGRYEIASSIDLINLISLAGGPMPDGALSKVSIIRILGKGEKITRQKIKIDLEDLSTLKQEDLQLMPGDLVMMDQTNWSVVRDAFGMFASFATVTLAATTIYSTATR